MANDFYNPTSNVPPEHTRSNPELYTGREFALVEDGFDKLPALSGSVSNRELIVSADETGLAVGLGRIVGSRASDFLLGASTQTVVGPLSFRGSSFYSLYALAPYTVDRGSAAADAIGLQIRLVFNAASPPASAVGIASNLNRDQAPGTSFVVWQTLTSTVILIEPALPDLASNGLATDVVELRGIIRTSAAGNIRLHVGRTSVITGSGSIVTLLAGTFLQLTELIEV